MFTNPFSPAGGARMDNAPPQNQQQQQQQQSFDGNSINNQNNNNNSDGSFTQPNKNQNQNNNNNNNNNNNQNNNQNQNNNADGGDLSLDDYSGLWSNDTNANGDGTPPKAETFLPALDPQKLNDTLSKLDFSNVATQEELQALQAGGENAVKANMSVMNKALRRSMATMYSAMTKMMEGAFAGAETRFLGKVPTHVTDVMTRNQLQNSNPIMSNPAYGPMVDAVRQQFQTKYPKATASQIETGVNKYFEQMAQNLSKKDDSKNNSQDDNAKLVKAGAPNADFEAWFNS